MFSFETLRLITTGDLTASMLNAAGQLSVGLLNVYLGFAATRRV